MRVQVTGVSMTSSVLVKMQKQSAKDPLQVMVGLNVTSSFVSRAMVFLAFLLGVRERLSWGI